AGYHVQRRERLGQQPRLPVDDRGHDREQLDPAGDAGEKPSRGMGPKHVVLGRPKMPDLPDVVHHADAVAPRLLGEPGYLTQPRAQLGRPAVPGAIRYGPTPPPLATPHPWPGRPVPSSTSGGC